ncbi:MAG: hypothetical protein ACLRTQ_09265 [Candidatus Borkfalkia sp.]
MDEPSTKRYDAIAVMNEWYRENFPDTNFRSMLPTYAASQLFGTNASDKIRRDYVKYFNEHVNPPS